MPVVCVIVRIPGGVAEGAGLKPFLGEVLEVGDAEGLHAAESID